MKSISCGLVIKSNDLFLICHPYNGKQWDIPKGNLEKNESELEAAYRETKEETGLDLVSTEGDLSILGRFKYYGKPKELVAFLLESETDLTKYPLQCLSFIDSGPLKGKPEHDRFAWVPLDQAILMTHKTVSKVFKKVAEYS
jgi:8-oxo-dGTP pyrophosphatase MutT (NUDIX family)